MADYFTNFSLQLRLPDEAAQAYALELCEHASRIRYHDEPPGNFPAELHEHLESWSFEVEADTVEQQPGLWLHSTDGGIDAACAFLQHLLQRFNLPEAVTFEWSHDCSKPRLDAYGGGAAVVTAQAIKTMSTSDWLHENTPAALNPQPSTLN